MSNFGAEFEKIWSPAEGIELSEFNKKLLTKCQCIEIPKINADDIDLKEFMRISSEFPIEFGTNTCRVISQPKERYPLIRQHIATAYPVVHERTLWLYLNFLEHKCQYGNSQELAVFQPLSLTDFVTRLLTNRCVSFYGKNDKYLLLTKERGASGFMQIGTPAEKPPLTLANVLSYDEIKLSALLSISSGTEFINDGSRANCGVTERDKSKIERDGVIIGIIGARLSRRDVMEFQDIVISKTQNVRQNGYGLDIDAEANTRAQDYRRIWKNFYGEKDFLHSEVQINNKRFGTTRNKMDMFDNVVMKKRYTMSFDTLLLESEARAAAAGRQAYIHVVGIGLGVWRVAEQQEKIFLETFEQRLRALIHKLTHISFVHFSWFTLSEWRGLKDGSIIKSETHPDGGIRISISKRNPSAKLLIPERENLLLIVSYPWDGNAMPGNEFWLKMLKSTGDPAAACSTLITEIHNPHINSKFINGDNLHVATEKYGVIHVAQYALKILN